jgi:glycosyltransferase involved in cell wall biosynthesis
MSKNSPKIKLCFIAPKAYTLFNPKVKHNFGGAEVDLYYLAVELAKDINYSITFITADYSNGAGVENIKDVNLIRTFNFKQNSIIGFIKFWKGLSRADAEYYIIKTISPGMFITALFCFIKRKSFIYRSAHTYNCDGTYIKKHKIYGILYRLSLKSAKMVFVQNSSERADLLSTTGVSSNSIPNGHPLPVVDISKKDTVLWVGRSAAIKQPELFIHLAAKFPEEKFIMISPRSTGDSNYERLKDEIGDLKNLEFIEFVEFAKVQAYFTSAKIFVNTSEAEGFPNTFIQACISSTPILSLQVNPDKVLDKYNIGISCSGDIEQLNEKLHLILTDNNLRLKMGNNAREYAEEKHNIKKIADIYKKILGDN